LCTSRIFSIKDAGIDSKIFHVWKSKGLVDFIERGKWARLTFVEYLWLRTLETMRKFGCSVKLMQAIYYDLFTKAYDENLAEKKMKSNHKFYTNLKKNRTLTDEESERLEYIEGYLEYPSSQIGERNEVTYFYELVLGCITYQMETGIIIFEDGTFTKFTNTPFENKKNTSPVIDITKPHLYIPISSYILEFIKTEEKDKFLVKAGLLSEDEYRVIREIRNKNVKSITVTFKEDGHKVEKIECDKKGQIKGEDAKKIMKLLGLKNYSGIELSTRNGSTLSFTHTEKKFF
jgi:hypothetical protein